MAKPRTRTKENGRAILATPASSDTLAPFERMRELTRRIVRVPRLEVTKKKERKRKGTGTV